MDDMSPSELRLRALELAVENDYVHTPESVVKVARKFYNFIKPSNAEATETESAIESMMADIEKCGTAIRSGSTFDQ